MEWSIWTNFHYLGLVKKELGQPILEVLKGVNSTYIGFFYLNQPKITGLHDTCKISSGLTFTYDQWIYIHNLWY